MNSMAGMLNLLVCTNYAKYAPDIFPLAVINAIKLLSLYKKEHVQVLYICTYVSA